MTDAAANIADSMEAIRVGIEQASEARERPPAHPLKDAIEAFAQAKTDIDQLTELLRYFAHLGDSQQLRDYREVRANLLRSRALLSTQQDVVARLTQAAAGLARLIEASEIKKKQAEKKSEPTAPAPAIEREPTAPPIEHAQSAPVAEAALRALTEAAPLAFPAAAPPSLPEAAPVAFPAAATPALPEATPLAFPAAAPPALPPAAPPSLPVAAPLLPPIEPAPAAAPGREDSHEQQIANAVFSEIESILRQPG